MDACDLELAVSHRSISFGSFGLVCGLGSGRFLFESVGV